MKPEAIINQLTKNQFVFECILEQVSFEQSIWKPEANKWCILEVVCHLLDEEKFDFRARTTSVLEDPKRPLVKFNPLDWVIENKYLSQDLTLVTQGFLQERSKSIKWLSSLKNPIWTNEYVHPKMGPLSAKFFLTNWLAHDYIHIRQINRLAYEYLQYKSGVDLNYAGDW